MSFASQRSLLFVPGDKPRMLEKAREAGADAVIIDLEDSVAEGSKTQAREITRAFLAETAGQRRHPHLVVRINAVTTAHWTADIEAVIEARPDGIVLPKPRSGADVVLLSDALDRLEAALGHDAGRIAILAIVTERAISLLSMASYAGATARLQAMAWGAEDLSAEIGAQTAIDDAGALSSPFRLARDLCLMGAAAAGAAAIDQVFVAIRDLDGLAKEARAAARDGFTGKMAIHPDQVPVINAAFTPTAAEIADAEGLIAAFAAKGDAAGAFLHRGRMVDAPHLARARRLVARARAAGRIG